MRTLSRIVLPALALLALYGCSAGILYTHTTQPLTIHHESAPAGGTEAKGDVKHIQVRWLGVMWDKNGIGEIASRNGLHELYTADLEYLSVLSVWRQYTVHLYGR